MSFPPYARRKASIFTTSQLVAAIRRCSKTRDLEEGKILHERTITAGCHTNKYVATVLITMYSRCRCMQLAKNVFHGITDKDIVTWNALIFGYVENGESSVALELFVTMDCEPDRVTYLALLKAYGSLANLKRSEKQYCLEKGRAVHGRLKELGHDTDVVVASTLVDMYSKCGSMHFAREVFNRMIHKSVVPWNCLIMGYVRNGECREALKLFRSIDCEPSNATYVAALKACGNLAKRESERQVCLQTGMAIHQQVGVRSDTVLENSLVDMYCRCGSVSLAREVFEKMIHRDVVSWNSLIRGYVEDGDSSTALELFRTMDCEPDRVTYLAVLKACGKSLKTGIAIHKQLEERGLLSDVALSSALVDMYSKCGRMPLARDVFEAMPRKDVIMWNCLLMGYVENAKNKEAMELFTSMDCEPDSFTYVAAVKACGGLASGVNIHRQVRECGLEGDVVLSSALVEMYCKCGSMRDAREVFDRMVDKNAVTWTCLILGYVENGQSFVAMELFTSMDSKPDALTYAAMLKACGDLTALPSGQHIHAVVCRRGLEADQPVGNALVDFYCKCGKTDTAGEIFKSMYLPDIASWTALIAGYASLGNSYEVFSLMREMEQGWLELDGVTFKCILVACNHVGLVDEGKMYFEYMSRCGISRTLEHYNCMVDMLGRANKLEEAYALVENMPFEADCVTWMTLLSACRKWKNVHLGKVAFDKLVCGNTQNAAAYVFMQDIYMRI